MEVSGVTADGALIPSSSVGNNNAWIDLADRVILEVNSWQAAELDSMHDIYYGTPCRRIARRSRSSGRLTGSVSCTCAARQTRSSWSSRPTTRITPHRPGRPIAIRG
jgi:acyl-CoA hydrolase